MEDIEELEKNLRSIGNEKQEYFGEGIYLDPRGKEGTRMKLKISCPRKYSLNRIQMAFACPSASNKAKMPFPTFQDFKRKR